MNMTFNFPTRLLIVILFSLAGSVFAEPKTTTLATKTIEPPPIIAGEVTQIKGQVTADDKVLQQGHKINVGAKIATGANSHVTFTMIDKATITLGENSKLAISAYRYQQNGEDNSIIMRIMGGIFRTVSGGVGKKKSDNYQVTTTCLLTIGIQGTDYQVNFKDNKESISTHKGVIVVEKANLFGAPKKALLGDQQKQRYLIQRKPAKGTRATGSSWKTFSKSNKPKDFPPPLEM